MENARMVVVDDQFMGAKYATCGGKTDATPGEEQIAWLTQQLAEARSKHERVWVMAHIPPGVDLKSTASHLDEACGAKGPKMYLSSEKLADVLAEYSDVVKLAIFAHTHMDEVRLLRTQGTEAAKGVPVKMVSSISPINGNAPSFTLARVDARTAELKDYRVIAASNATGVGTEWREEYDWGKTFHESAFSGRGLGEEIAGLRADSAGEKETSAAYMKNFFVGITDPRLALVWPQYACGLEDDSAQGFKRCVCGAGR
jgi:sphingomyelin phosphodiesterase acid-like 3